MHSEGLTPEDVFFSVVRPFDLALWRIHSSIQVTYAKQTLSATITASNFHIDRFPGFYTPPHATSPPTSSEKIKLTHDG